MKIVIGHLYYDLMNLYGENGNIKVLEYQLKKQKIDVEILNLSLDDKIDFKKLDLIYIGSGTEKNRNIVLDDLLKYKNEIKDAYKNNKFFLITGNALELFGEYLIDNDNIVHKCLNLFKFYTKEQKDRIVKEVSIKSKFVDDNLLGFMNHQGIIYNKNDKIEYGIYKNNFFGSYLLGPILARNPLFMKYFIEKLINSKYKKFKIKEFNTSLDEEAYLDYIAFKNS